MIGVSQIPTFREVIMEWNLPNILTLSRMYLGAISVIALLSGGDSDTTFAAAGILLGWEVTDFLDGTLARKYGKGSDWGKVMDPMADVALHVPVFLFLWWFDYMPIWFCVIIVLREVTITVGRQLVRTNGGGAVGAGFLGKIKTWSYAITQIFMILVIGCEQSGLRHVIDWGWPTSIVLYTISAGLSAYTGYGYTVEFTKVLWKKFQS